MRRYALLLMLLYAMSANSQIVFFDNAEQVLALGKDSVINLAISYLHNSGFSKVVPNQFDRLEVQTDGNEVRVCFNRSIQYIPKDTYVIHTATVTLVQPNISWNPYGNKRAPTQAKQFYKYSAEDIKAIDFALFGKQVFSDGITVFIYENENYYSVTEKNEMGGEGGYKVYKISGEKKEPWHLNASPTHTGGGFKNVEW